MGERKVLNKYIPADFDPRMVPRSKKPKDNLVPVRMMLPFSIQCTTCSTFMYRGRKFNSKKEMMSGPNGKYLTIQRYRFYIKCTHCSRPVTFSTDPKNADYEMESGATRNYEIWHDKTKSNTQEEQDEEYEESLDPMKALENRVLDSQREMADLDNLDEIKAMNKKHLHMLKNKNNDSSMNQIHDILSLRKDTNLDTTLATSLTELNQHGLTNDEEALVQSVKFQKSAKRLTKDDEQIFDLKRQKVSTAKDNEYDQKFAAISKKALPIMPVITIKKRIKVDNCAKAKLKKSEDSSSSEEEGLGGLLGAYASSESD